MNTPLPKFSLDALNNGEKEAYNYLFRSYYSGLCFFASKLIGYEEAEDIVDDIFLNMYLRREQFSSEIHVKAYLYRCVKNACLNQIKISGRAKARHEAFTAQQGFTVESYLHEVTKTEVIRQLHLAVQSLPAGCRQVIQMTFIEGLSNQEAAEKLGLSLQTVKNQKLRALSLLRKRLPNDIYILLAAYPFWELAEHFKR